jgi:hypothetical protein
VDKFKRGGEFNIDFTRDIVLNLVGMMASPRPLGTGNLHVGDVCASCSDHSLPFPFDESVFILTAGGSRMYSARLIR